MRTSENLLALRPELALPPASTPIEQFQNEVLRPVLKFQHSILLRIALSYKSKYKLHTETEAEKLAFRLRLQKDTKIRNLLLGTVVGCMTEEEYLYFEQENAELSARTIKMILQRIESDERW